VLAVLGIVGAVALYFVVSSALEQGAVAVAEVIVETYDEAKAQGAIREEHAALFDGLVATAQGDDATMWANVLIAGVVMPAVEDGEITDEEVGAAERVRDFLQEHPGAGIGDFAEFMGENPDLAETMQDMQNQFQEQ
jgi:hypothetical protein